MYRVVIVDDEPLMLEGMRLMIDWASCGFELSATARNAQEALHLVDALRPHLLITDVRMPGMLGTDLAAIVRHYHPETILLFFSGYKDFAFAQSAIRYGAFGYLVKPIDSDEVHETLRAVRAELERREQQTDKKMPVLRDIVLRRLSSGDADCLSRAAVLLDIKRDMPCYCAVLRFSAPLPEKAQFLLLPGSFMLAPNLYGMAFKQIERDAGVLLELKERLESALGIETRIGVGSVGRGEEGFGRSLQEALDALGLLFEMQGPLRMYHPYDADTAAWLLAIRQTALYNAWEQEDEEVFLQELKRLRRLAAEKKPSLFALRYMAHSLEILLSTHSPETTLTDLWARETLAPEAWIDAFEARTLEMWRNRRSAEQYPAPVLATLDYVRDHYAERASIGELAEAQSMNPAYLGQLIRRSTGKTFHQLLLDTRLLHACRLLRQTNRPICEIASAVGFRDVDYFSGQFRGHMGMSPNAYRSAEKEGQA